MVPGAPRVAVLSHELWRDELGADPEAVGELLVLDGEPHRVVGVLPGGFEVPRLDWLRLWTPPPFSLRDEENLDWRGFTVLARAAEGRSPGDVEAELGVIEADLGREHPESHRGWGVEVRGLHDYLVEDVRTTLLLFLGAVALVLSVAAANVAHLVLARQAVRRRELAVRTALGASRGQLARMALAEGLVLSVAACGLGIGLALAVTDLFLEMAPSTIPRLDQVHLDVGVAGFAIVLALASTLLFGVLPGARRSDRQLGGLLHAAAAGGSPDRGRMRRALLVGEVALAVTLLVGAGLLARSFVELLTWDPGFERDHLAVAFLLSSQGKYPEARDVLRAHEAAAEAVAGLPGVTSVGMASAGPLFGGRETARALPGAAGGAAGVASGEGTSVRWYDVGPDYFATLGVPVVRGRGLSPADRLGQPAVALVNETAARRLWPGADPVGRLLRVSELDRGLEVVGVVRDVPPLRPDEPVEAEVYWPYAQFPRWGVHLVIRTATDPAAVLPAARDRLAELDPDLQTGRWATFGDLMARQVRQPRFTLLLVVVFAAVAAILAAVGIYGLLSYLVARRTREIGVRMALGAERRRVEAAVVGQALRLTAVGLMLGLAGALAAGRLLGSLLHGVAPTDPWTYAAVAAVVVAAATLASWLPARRAGALDPRTALRSE